MGDFFLTLLNMSITASWLIMAVILVRLIFRKMPKWINCLLWGAVALRLCCPFSIESAFSLQPSPEPIKTSTIVESGEVVSHVPSIDSNSTFVTQKVNPVLRDTFTYEKTESVSPLQMVTEIAGYIWLVGMLILFIYAIVSISRMHFKVREAIPYEKNTYICDAVNTPFILGVIRPRIYLPSTLNEGEISYILAHEKAHLKRLDNIWKPIGYLLLCVYWFNPLCIIAYVLLCKDIEFACDEKVIKEMSFSDKKEYSKVLLSCATQRRFVLAYPLAFGEVSVKERVKTVLNYKKAALGVTILALVAGVIIAVCFLTNPADKSDEKTNASANELTMQKLIDIVTSETFNKTQSEKGIQFWNTYSNFEEDIEIDIVSKGRSKTYKLRYEKRTFALDIFYFEKNNQIYRIQLWNIDDNDSVYLYATDSYYTVDTDIESFLQREYPLPVEIRDGYYESGKLQSEVKLGAYQECFFLEYFSGCYFESENYKEPVHGNASKEAYSLGGVGQCTDPDVNEREVFENGNLVECHYNENHLIFELIETFKTDKYSACLYKYTFDLFTAAEEGNLVEEGAPTTSNYWVVFFTEGQGKPLYVKFFNCEYYPQHVAIDSVPASQKDVNDTEDVSQYTDEEIKDTLLGNWKVSKFLGFDAIQNDYTIFPDGHDIIGNTIVFSEENFSSQGIKKYKRYQSEVFNPVYEVSDLKEKCGISYMTDGVEEDTELYYALLNSEFQELSIIGVVDGINNSPSSVSIMISSDRKVVLLWMDAEYYLLTKEDDLATDDTRVSDEIIEAYEQVNILHVDIPYTLSEMAMCNMQEGWALTTNNEILFTDSSLENFSVVRQVEGVSSLNDGLVDICAVDHQTVYAAYISEDSRLFVEYTKDGGDNWHQTLVDLKEEPVDGCGSAYISFSDTNHGYLLYCSSPAMGQMTKLLFYTEDAGESFSFAGDLSNLSGYPQGISFSEGKCYIAVTYHGEDNYMYVKESGTDIWKIAEVISLPKGFTYIDGFAPAFDIEDRQEGMLVLKAVGDDSRYLLFATKDGGESWTINGEIPLDTIGSYFYVGDNHFYFIDNMGSLYRTM